jgi:hypothetical protein
MDFIERLFGISPDGGDGSFELMLIAIPIVVLVVLSGAALRRMPRGRS